MSGPRALFLKAHVKGHFQNGVWVEPYDTKAPSGKDHWWSKPFSGFSKPGSQSHGSQGSYGGHSGGYGGPPKPKPKPAAFHPQLDHNGDDVPIYKLSHATPLDAFEHADQIATVLPGGETPGALHGVPFAPWDDAPRSLEEWQDVEGQAAIDEPPFERKFGKKSGAGVIVQEPDGRVWVIHPTNGFGGYKGSFPKGTVEDGLGLQASAIKEAWEESGLKVEITGFLMDVDRTTSKARYYLARRVGGAPSDCGWESQAVSLVPVAQLYTALNRDTDHGLAEMLGAGPRPKPKYPSYSSPTKAAEPGPGDRHSPGEPKQGKLF